MKRSSLKRAPGLVVSGLWIISSAVVFAASPVPSTLPSPVASPEALPSSLPSVLPSGPPLPPLTKKETTTLYREFQRAQQQEISALEHRQRLEARDLKIAQKHAYKTWMRDEKGKRKDALKEGYGGQLVKSYVQDFTRRREALWAEQRAERQRQKSEHDTQRAKLREEQSGRVKTFKEALDRGERPALVLWPSPGR